MSKVCGVCQKEFPTMWKAKTKTEPQMCRTCALKSKGTPIGNYTMIKVSDVVKDLVKEQKLSTSKPRTKIKKVSDKQSKINAAYSVLRSQFIKARPYCEARLEGCTGQAEHVHHQYMGSNKRKHYLNTLTWTPICHSCHTICHDKLSKEEQIEKGLRILD